MLILSRCFITFCAAGRPAATMVHGKIQNSSRGVVRMRMVGEVSASLQARSSVWLERFLDTEEVDGSSPFGPTIIFIGIKRIAKIL
jgi:hypothetical protein